jgi:NTE family protein
MSRVGKTETRLASPAATVFAKHDLRVLVLQGGGALGAYQAGVYEGLAAVGFASNWVAGVSIGGINAALIAGNPPERRIERLRAFWNLVSARAPFALPFAMKFARPWMNQMSAGVTMAFGVPGFFTPRLVMPQLVPDGSPGALSFYDTEPLRKTLNELVDFDYINSGNVRLSLGAVNVRTGESVYFDTTTHKITASHVMASGALPPGFPPVEIDGEYYWDGGIMSNTPLQYVCEDFRISALVVVVDLFSGKGELPLNLNEALERAKDIQYQSKQRLTDSRIRTIEALRSALSAVLGKLPQSLRSDPQVQKLAAVSQRGPLSLIHLVNRHDTGSTHFKDYEFSRAAVEDLWQGGQSDIEKMLSHPEDCHVTDYGNGVNAFDLAIGADHGRSRGQEARIRDAAHESGVSARALPLR